MDGDDISLLSSRLGTKQHWDEAYDLELKNFKEFGDEGEIWFGEQCQRRLVNWLDRNDDITKFDSVIDIGCGNAALLQQLRQRGFTELTGVDYSEAAIDLAKYVCEDGHSSIKLEVCDILSPSAVGPLAARYRICIDKGTFDAISLQPDKSARNTYAERVRSLLTDDGYFMITSCNWTSQELTSFFHKDFRVHTEIQASTFQFGNKCGSTVASLVFQKRECETNKPMKPCDVEKSYGID